MSSWFGAWKRTLSSTLLNESTFGYNRLNTARQPHPEVPAIQASLPPGVHVAGYDVRASSAEEVRKRRWLGGVVEPVDDAHCLFRTSDDNLDWLAMRIAMLGFEFECHGPPELVEEWRNRVELVVERHSEPPELAKEVRKAAVRSARMWALISAIQVVLPGLLLIEHFPSQLAAERRDPVEEGLALRLSQQLGVADLVDPLCPRQDRRPPGRPRSRRVPGSALEGGSGPERVPRRPDIGCGARDHRPRPRRRRPPRRVPCPRRRGGT